MSDLYITDLLESLYPVAQLSTENMQHLLEQGQLVAVQSGAKLNASEEQNHLLYVVEGSIAMLVNNKAEVFDASSERAKSPIFSEHQLKDIAIIASSGRLLRLDRNLFQALQAQQNEAGYEMEDIELTETENRIFLQIYQACLAKTIMLPTLPEVALKIQQTINDKDFDINNLSHIIQADLGIATGLLQAANSAAYAGTKPVANLRDAIVRMGMNTTRKLVLSISLERVFKTRSEALSQYMHTLWDNSVNISALSYVIGKHCRSQNFDPDQAMLAGLLCDIGDVCVLNYFEDQDIDLSYTEIANVAAKLHDIVGEIVVDSWGMGNDIKEVVRESRKWERNTPDDKADYCDIVLLARLYQHLQKNGESHLPRYDNTPSFARLKFAKQDNALEWCIIDNSRAEIDAIVHVLNPVS